MTKLSHISCVIIVKNAANTIESVLSSLSCFTDVVLYDNGSDDGTQEIAARFSNVNLVEGPFLGFGESKQKASEYAQNDWILSLDADEVLDSDFIAALRDLKLDKQCAYSISRSNYYRENEIKHCWGRDIIVRLYNRAVTNFNSSKVHELVEVSGMEVVPLSGTVRHYPYQTISQFIHKVDTYSSLFAEGAQGVKKSSPAKAFFNSGFSFFKTYILKRGFMDGYAGLVIAFSHMATNFYKYIKLYELNQLLLTEQADKERSDDN